MIKRISTVLRSDIYWTLVFSVFVFLFLNPFGSGPLRSVLYLMMIIPAFILISKEDILSLLSFPPFMLLLLLCLYAIFISIDTDWLSKTFASSLLMIGLMLSAMRLPQPSVDAVMKGSLLFVVALITYILLNALYLYFTKAWAFPSRLPPMFGEIKSVIFAADLLIAGLVTYSWSCLKTKRYWSLVFMQFVVLIVALVLLQTRSAIVVWIVSMAVLTAKQLKEVRGMAKATGIFAAIAATFWWVTSSMGIFSELVQRGDSYRTEIWSGQLDKLYECGVIAGCGWGSSLKFLAKDGLQISHMHSMYMQHLNWGGLVGLALLLATIGLPLIQGIRTSYYASWPLLAGCIALIFDGKSLLSMPNERWLLINLPLAVLIAGLFKQKTLDEYSGAR